MSAQLGKSQSRMNGGHEGAGGRDLHVGCFHRGVLPPTAPLPIASATLTGMALAAWRQGVERFHVACIGEGSSSSGEWWESLNLAATRGLPISYILQNNQIALDTPPLNQSNVELWADKAVAMGMPSWTIDGSDPASWHASTATAREFALEGGGPTLIHVETMRGCGHAHHHDDLYLGAESGNPPGYVDRDLLSYWQEKDPIPNHRQILLDLGVKEADLSQMEKEEQDASDSARVDLEEMPWPEPETITKGVTLLHDADSHKDHLQRISTEDFEGSAAPLAVGESTLTYVESGGWTYARAIQQAMVEIAESYGNDTIFMGEDMEIAGAFGMNIALKNAGHSEKLLDMPLCEAIIIHSATGAALAGMRPIAEIQFGGFAALAHNALINNAAMLKWRWGAEIPLTVRIALGGKTRSGPFHANMIESWYANDPGLVVLSPATPQDAYDLLLEAAELNGPVLFLEHIGLYGLRGGLTGWGMNINQDVDVDSVKTAIGEGKHHRLGKAKVIRGGSDLTVVTWGAMLHLAKQAADELANEGIELEVIDLGTLIPFDAQTCIDSVKRCGRLLVLQEGQWAGGIGHTIQSRILEETFYLLEAAPVVVGALDIPVPFSPPLEDHSIPSLSHIIEISRTIVKS
jgi:2-oxoisovalerate dehydrogenase E1 component